MFLRAMMARSLVSSWSRLRSSISLDTHPEPLVKGLRGATLGKTYSENMPHEEKRSRKVGRFDFHRRMEFRARGAQGQAARFGGRKQEWRAKNDTEQR